jgi:hypothetical protein
MTQDEALKLGLEALEGFIPYLPLKDEAQCNRYDKAIAAIKEALAQPEQEPVAHPFEDEAVISSLSWAAGLIEQGYRACGGHNGADSWLMNYADKQGERIRQADHREWEKVNGRWQVKVTPPIKAAHGIKEQDMTTQTEALKLALEALEGFYEYGYDRLECFEYVTAIKEALAKPEQEPVAWEQFYPDIGKPKFVAHPEQEPVMHPREFKDNDLFLTRKEAFAIDDERRRLMQENEKLTGQLRKIDRELSMLKYKESESFDRTASHMVNEYVAYNEPVAIRYDFDGYGYKYMDAGSGSDWQTRVQGEPLYTTPKIEVGCAECGVGNNHALYCVTCAENYLKEKNT